MLKQLTSLTISALLSLLIACGGSDSEKTTQQSAVSETAAVSDDDESKGENLIDSDVPAPAGLTFGQKDFEGLGTMALPSGKDWVVEDKIYYNEALDMTVKIQTQNDGFLDMIKEYTEDYYKNNLRDAKDYHETSRKFGQLSGYAGAIMAGTFNNGQPYVTKDFLFFTPNQCTILQVRVNEKDKDKLEPVADYMVASLKK